MKEELMGLLNKIFNRKPKVEKYTEELRYLASLYCIANEHKNINLFIGYATVPLTHVIADRFRSYYRDTLWGIGSKRHVVVDYIEYLSEDTLIFRWHIVHQNVKLTRSYDLALGESITEDWVYNFVDKMVIDILPVSKTI